MAELFEFVAYVLFHGVWSLLGGVFEWAVTRRPRPEKSQDQKYERPADLRDLGGRLR